MNYSKYQSLNIKLLLMYFGFLCLDAVFGASTLTQVSHSAVCVVVFDLAEYFTVRSLPQIISVETPLWCVHATVPLPMSAILISHKLGVCHYPSK